MAWRWRFGYVAVLTIGASACQHPQSIGMPFLGKEVENSSEEVTLTGWYKHSGEAVIFDSQEAMLHDLVYPYCISGILSNDAIKSHEKFSGKKVSVKARRLEYSLLPRVGEIGSRATINNIQIKNWCHGPYVLEINSINLEVP